MLTPTPTPRRRRSYAERRILELLSMHPTGRISYDDIAAIIGFDRRSVITIITRLCYNGQVQIVAAGRGKTPNQYRLQAEPQRAVQSL